jgi:hypothetical protein
MILSKQKQNFVLDKVIESIHNSYDYDMNSMSYSKTFNLKYSIKGMVRGDTYKLKLYFYQNALTKITLSRGEGDVEIDLDGNDIKFRTIESLMYNKVKEIDDIKFKKIFPEYDIIEERNDVLDELLKEEKREIPTVPSSDREQLNEGVSDEGVSDKGVKRKWYDILKF